MKREMNVQDAGRLLGMINNGMYREMEKKGLPGEAEGLSGKNAVIIGFLSHNQDQRICQKDLEKAFNVTRSTASKVLTLMEKKGFVERRSVQEDARLKEIVLTDEARKLAQSMEAERTAMEQRLIRGFSEEEKNQLMEYLNRILDNLYDEKEEL